VNESLAIPTSINLHFVLKCSRCAPDSHRYIRCLMSTNSHARDSKAIQHSLPFDSMNLMAKLSKIYLSTLQILTATLDNFKSKDMTIS